MIFTFFTISSSSISDLIGYIGALWSDLTPILVVVLALSLGLFIVNAILKIMSSKTHAPEAGWYHQFREGKPTFRGRYYEKGEAFDVNEEDDDDDDDDL